MGAAIGALLGLATGGLAGYASKKAADRHQQDTMLLELVAKNPQLAASPEMQKALTRIGDKELATTFGSIADLTNQAIKGMPSMDAGGAAPAANTPASGGFTPGPGALGQIHQGGDANNPQHIQDYINQVQTWADQNRTVPGIAEIAKEHIANAQKQIEWLTKQQSAGVKPFSAWLAEHPGGTVEDYQKMLKSQGAYWRTTVAPDGSSVQVPFERGADGLWHPMGIEEGAPGASSPADGGVSYGGLRTKLDANQQKQLDAVRNVREQMPRLQGLISALPPNASPGDFAKQYLKYRTPFGALGPADPAFTEYFQQLGQLKTDLYAAAAGGGRGKYLFEYLQQHIPDEKDPPARAMEKLRGFDEGRFNALVGNLIGSGANIPGMPAAKPPRPSFPYVQSYQKGNDYFVQGKDGKYYHFDTGANSWQQVTP